MSSGLKYEVEQFTFSIVPSNNGRYIKNAIVFTVENYGEKLSEEQARELNMLYQNELENFSLRLKERIINRLCEINNRNGNNSDFSDGCLQKVDVFEIPKQPKFNNQIDADIKYLQQILFNSLKIPKAGPICECGGKKLKIPHSRWCACFKE